jgi:hypothetical protein
MSGVFLLVDTTNGRALARHDSWIGVSALAYIQFANCDTLITRLGENKGFSAYDSDMLRSIYVAAGGKAGDVATAAYPTLISAVRKLMEASDWLILPFTVEQLQTQAWKIKPTDSRPYAFNPNGETPDLLPKWHSAPQRNRERYECQHWVNFSTQPTGGGEAGQSGSQSGVSELRQKGKKRKLGTRRRNRRDRNFNEDYQVTDNNTTSEATNVNQTTAAPAKKAAKKTAAPAKKAAAKKVAATAPAKKAAKKVAGKVPAKKAATKKVATTKKVAKSTGGEKRVEKNGITRPKAGTTGDKIWSTADKLSSPKNPASYAKVAKALEKHGVSEDSSRTGYQRWRTFNGHTGRITD